MTLAQHIHNNREQPRRTIELDNGCVVEVRGYSLYLRSNGESARIGIIDAYGRAIVFRDWYKRLEDELGELPSDLIEDK